MKLDATGAARFATFLGGSGVEVLFAPADFPINWKLCTVALAQNGITVLGESFGGGFPVTNQSQPGVGWDVFVSRLDATGSRLLASTYFAGNQNDFADALVVDGRGETVFVGRTYSSNLPVTPNAWSQSNLGSLDMVVARLDAAYSLPPLYCTYLGGAGEDVASALLLEDSGTIVVGGNTASVNFPTTVGYAPAAELSGRSRAGAGPPEHEWHDVLAGAIPAARR